MASQWFANGIQKPMTSAVTLTSSVKAVLINSTGNATLNVDTNDFLDDILAAWRADTAFVAVSTVNAIVGANNHVNFGKTQTIVFTTVTGGGQIAKGIVVFTSDATKATSELICYCTFTANVTPDGGNVDVTLNASGFARASY